MPNRKKVVLTGASGMIAGLVLPTLRAQYDLTLLDVRNTHYRGVSASFCVDGGDVEDATDVDVKKSRKATLNGC